MASISQEGDLNRNQQRLLAKTDTPGTDHNQIVWRVRCERPEGDSVCGYTYGANGSDFFQRKCPKCQGGLAGIPTGENGEVVELPSARQRRKGGSHLKLVESAAPRTYQEPDYVAAVVAHIRWCHEVRRNALISIRLVDDGVRNLMIDARGHTHDVTADDLAYNKRIIKQIEGFLMACGEPLED